MAEHRCPHCGQPLREQRLGIHLSPLKARIFDAIKRAGHAGIDTTDLHALVLAFHIRPIVRRTIKAHVRQINDVLEETDWRIDGTQGRGGGYVLVSRDQPRRTNRLPLRRRKVPLTPAQRSEVYRANINKRWHPERRQ